MPNSFPEETEEDWMKTLWNELQEKNVKGNKGKAPITEIDLDKEQMNFDIESRYGVAGPSSSKSSKASTMKELPSFLGDVDSAKDVRRVPSQYHPTPTPNVLDTANLQALLSTPVKVTLPLVANVLKVKPALWQEVIKCFTKMGI